MKKDEVLDILRDYKKNHARKYGILNIGVFGSTARDEAGSDSDVDICIVTDTPNPFILVPIKDDIEKLVKKHVDIIRVRDKMNPYLRERVERDGRYV